MPVVDGNTLGGSTLRADICVIGGGPAGIVVASELAAEGRDVVVIEAGSQPYDRHQARFLPRSVVGHVWGAQSGARGVNRGIPYYSLRMSRVRGIGGSTQALKAHGLRLRPLDAIDFKSDTTANWPLAYEEFVSFLDDAVQYCGIPEAGIVWDATDGSFDRNRMSELAKVCFRHAPRTAFQLKGVQAGNTRHQRWITSAIATEFRVDSAGYVTRVRVSTRSHSSFTVEARNVVLAAGGVDNARVLLANPPLLEAMGHSATHVGRYFMEHLHYVAGHLIPTGPDAQREIAQYFSSRDGWDPWITVADATTRLESLARSAFSAVPVYSSSLAPGVNALGRMARVVPYGPFDRPLWAREMAVVLRGTPTIASAIVDRFDPSSKRGHFAIIAMSEQTPNSSSRITLSNRRDYSGLRLPVLDWQLKEHDVESARHSAEILGNNLSAAGLGEFVPTWIRPDERLPPVLGGWHHIGTTRMSAEADGGVVDANSRVYGAPNLFIAGSSVFPTGGFANPTLSLVALAVRLGRHLARMS